MSRDSTIIIKKTDDYIYCDVPYNEDFIRQANKMHGIWCTCPEIDYPDKIWKFSINQENTLYFWIASVFPNITPTTYVNNTPIKQQQQVTTQEENKTPTTDDLLSAIKLVINQEVIQAGQALTDDINRVGIKATDASRLALQVSNILDNHVKVATKSLDEYNQELINLKAKIQQLEKSNPVIINHILDNKEVKQINVGVQHFKFDYILRLVKSLSPKMRNVFISGPVGSGKTTLVENIAKALDISFHANGAIDSEYKLSGFIDANGNIISTEFRKAWENGGVYLFDEIDGSMASAILAFNAALANGFATFPDKIVVRHPDCYVFACGNTWGFGPTAEFVGRSKLDAATLNRFTKVFMPYDEPFERKIANNNDWCDAIQNTRKLVAQKEVKVIISPRSTIRGAEMLAANLMTRQEILEAEFSDLMSLTSWPSFNKHLLDFVNNKTTTPVVNTTTESSQDYIYLHGYNDKLLTISWVRDVSGLGLKDAKDLVELPLPVKIPCVLRTQYEAINNRPWNIKAGLKAISF